MSTANTLSHPSVSSRPKGRFCPKCGSSRIQRSRRRGGLEHVLTLLGGRIRRCHDCRSRQASFPFVTIPLGRSDESAFLATEVAIAASGIIICLVFVWWIIQRAAADAG